MDRGLLISSREIEAAITNNQPSIERRPRLHSGVKCRETGPQNPDHTDPIHASNIEEKRFRILTVSHSWSGPSRPQSHTPGRDRSVHNLTFLIEIICSQSHAPG